jgi:hypothetical protein
LNITRTPGSERRSAVTLVPGPFTAVSRRHSTAVFGNSEDLTVASLFCRETLDMLAEKSAMRR